MQPTPAYFFDGQTARRHDVEVSLATGERDLLIKGETLPGPLIWPLARLRAERDSANPDQLTLLKHADSVDESPRDPARLVVTDPQAVAWLRDIGPHLFKRDVKTGTGLKVATYAAGAVGAALLMLFVILPAMANTLAQVIPIERETAFGRTVVQQMTRFLGSAEREGFICSDPEGVAAAQTMLVRLSEGTELEYDIELQVFDHPLINAFAAPGGHVVLTKGLLTSAENADAVAGVLAHEIGHVEARDPTRAALRATGSAGLLSMVLGDFTGGTLFAFVGEHMINTSYSRDAENAADRFALEMLNASNTSADGFAGFFDFIDEEMGSFMPEYLSTHPDTAGRATAARAFAETQTGTEPLLSDTEWTALKGICD